VGWLNKRQASGRQRIEAKVDLVLTLALEAGESVLASGFALVMPRMKIALFGVLGTFFMRQYWVVLTDRRLILIRFPNTGGQPRFEVGIPRSGLRLIRDKQGPLNRQLTLESDGWKARLSFGALYKADVEAISSALGAR
jgi:hypothetical protein